MFSLGQIIVMNERLEAGKAALRAKALNTPGGHPKDAEKGRKTGGVDKGEISWQVKSLTVFHH